MSLTFQAIASTKLPIINFYGALGYVSGKIITTDILGTYSVQSAFQESLL